MTELRRRALQAHMANATLERRSRSGFPRGALWALLFPAALLWAFALGWLLYLELHHP